MSQLYSTHYPQAMTPPPDRRSTAAFDALEDISDSSEFEEYGHEIALVMKELEEQTAARPTYMSEQPEVTWKMRKTLVLWLIEVHSEYHLRQETLYLAVNILDRFCSLRKVPRTQYQLLGVTALWIAAKYEENHGSVPTLKQLYSICCDSYPEREFIQMELVLLNEIKFVLGHPTAEAFLKANCRFMNCVEPQSRALARYILEFTLIHKEFLVFPPSMLATASILVAEIIRGNHNYNFSDPNLCDCMVALSEHLMQPPETLVKKFASNKFLRSAIVVRNWVEIGCPNRHLIGQPSPSPSPAYSGLPTPPKYPLPAPAPANSWDIPRTPISPSMVSSLPAYWVSQLSQQEEATAAYGGLLGTSISSQSSCSSASSTSSAASSASISSMTSITSALLTASLETRLPPQHPRRANDHQLEHFPTVYMS
ncbi:hypothetical protein SmJEL517_g03702 [Synchytrium microbalum]|uniref:Uncharacterized protein n=1 Tax=Synchytrium microbalum TaxID=1806994 RepID=A0A507C2U6_9FUNG|nr:uncharacterized protein SmJEL517_g03702 [Synchytrium microbalum]TPX33369.1 hypothetical protein SmJEL517_g03702 [Synchytrium microbalum]